MNQIKFFETKEQYLNFRKAFAAAVNDPRAKKGKPQPPNGYKERGWMTGAHFMLLNAVRGLPLERGFSKITAERKLENGAIADGAINANRRYLEDVITNAKAYVANKPADLKNYPSWRYGKATSQEEANQKQQDYYRNRVETFLLPFGGYLTIQDVARIELK